MDRRTDAVVEGLEEDFLKVIGIIKNRHRFPRYHGLATERCAKILNRIELFAPDRLNDYAQRYNGSQLLVLGPDELASEGLSLLVLPEDVKDVRNPNEKIKVLSRIASSFAKYIQEEDLNQGIGKNDEVYLKMVQALYILDKQKAEECRENYNRIARSKKPTGKIKQIVEVGKHFGYGLSVE